MFVVGRESKADKSAMAKASWKVRLAKDTKVLQKSLDTCFQRGGPTKVCKQCMKHRPLTGGWYINSKHATGRKAWCRPCQLENAGDYTIREPGMEAPTIGVLSDIDPVQAVEDIVWN